MTTKISNTVLDLTVLNQAIDTGGNAITGLPLVPTASDEATSKDYVDGLIGGGIFLPLSGGTMTGNISLASTNRITDMAAPVNPSDAVTLSHYEDASNLTVGILPSGRLSGTYGINITGNAATASTATSATTAGTASNATNLGGQPDTYYATNQIILLDNPVLLAGDNLTVNAWTNLTHATLSGDNATAALLSVHVDGANNSDRTDIYVANPSAGSRPATPAYNTWPHAATSENTTTSMTAALSGSIATTWVTLNVSYQLSYYVYKPIGAGGSEGYIWLLGYMKSGQ